MIVDTLGKLLGAGICVVRAAKREVLGERFEYESLTTLPEDVGPPIDFERGVAALRDAREADET